MYLEMIYQTIKEEMSWICDCEKKIEQLQQEMMRLKQINAEELSRMESKLERKINDQIIQFVVNYKAEMETLRERKERGRKD